MKSELKKPCPDLLTVWQVAGILNSDPRQWVSSIPHYDIGSNGRSKRYHPDDVTRYMERQRVK